tara:strand:- start:110 stop:358 length:249 start_codon:yes stop_codon:yes gene_type:complete
MDKASFTTKNIHFLRRALSLNAGSLITPQMLQPLSSQTKHLPSTKKAALQSLAHQKNPEGSILNTNFWADSSTTLDAISQYH